MPPLPNKSSSNDTFRHFAARLAKLIGSSWAFIAALAFIVVWWVFHAVEGFPDRALIWVSSVCTVVTFLIVFIIQNTQNRHNRAMQLKLDELIKSQNRASNELVGLEDFTDEELDAVQKEFQDLRQAVINRHRAKKTASK